MIYVLDPDGATLTLTHDTGVTDQDRDWARGLRLPLGSGMFGRAVADGCVLVTDDYAADSSFPHTAEADRVVAEAGIRSMVVAPLPGDAGPIGALGVFSGRPAAFGEAEAALVRALAEHAAAAAVNLRLIAELGRSREQVARRAERERSLRRLVGDLVAIRDVDELLQRTVDEAARLAGADGAMLGRMLLGGGVGPGYDSGEPQGRAAALLRANTVGTGEGMLGLAAAERRVVVTDDYLADARFVHVPDSDDLCRELGLASLVAAPLLSGGEVLGVLGVYSSRRAAFDEEDVALIAAFADQAAAALTNARLIEELGRSRTELARRAEAERSLREIAGKLAAIRQPQALLESAVAAAARLAGADWAEIAEVDEVGRIRWAYDAGLDDAVVRDALHALDLRIGEGVLGRAVAERRVVVSDDYLADPSFEHRPASDEFARRVGFRSLVAAPLMTEAGVVGVLGVHSSRPAAFDPDDVALVAALADTAAVAMANAALIEALDRSRGQLERRVAAEHAMGEIVAGLAAIRDPATLLQQAVDAAARLVDADGALIDTVEADGRVRAGYFARVDDPELLGRLRSLELHVGQGLFGQALAERRVVAVDDYIGSGLPPAVPGSDDLVRRLELRSLVAAPLLTDAGPVGLLAVYSRRPGAFGPDDVALIAAFADHAAVAMTNARLIEALRRSEVELASRAESERTLRQIGARITSLRDPAEVLQQVVDETRRLLGSDGAHLTLLEDGGRDLVPAVVAGGDPGLHAWLKTQRFPLDGGINGLAASLGEPVWTEDYLVDPRIPHEPDDQDVADRLGLRAVAVAPLRASDQGVVGTLAVSYRAPRAVPGAAIGQLSALADQAAIVVANVRLYDRLRESEARYRYLVENSPDLVWSLDRQGRLILLSETCERLTGWRSEELLGQHFSVLVHPDSTDVAVRDWWTETAGPIREVRSRFHLRHRDGSAIPVEFRGILAAEEGHFSWAHGSVRDIREQDRLERELSESEARYRGLVQTLPDGVWGAEADGRFNFWSETATGLYGWAPDEVVGRHWSAIVAPESLYAAETAWQALVDGTEAVVRVPIEMLHRDGSRTPSEVSAVPLRRDGSFAGAHGSLRDVSERERLERELRESEAQYRYLVEHSPDIVWAADAEGRFSFMSETSERLLGWRPDELVGRHFSAVIHPESQTYVSGQWQASLSGGPARELRYRFVAQHRDGSRVPVEMHARTIVEDGRYLGAHGAVRDLRERERLERDLRRQAAELAASEERSHLARELHDSVTQALFSMTLVTRSIEVLLGRDPAAALPKLETLRDLQRDALAEMRALIFELRPASLETDGLVAALRTHAAAVQGRTGLPVVLQADEQERFAPEVEAALFRIAQEALHNVVKHAAAHGVQMTLARDGGRIRLAVEDDGMGFDPATVPAGHLGLAGMRARAEKLGGQLDVETAPGRGTRVEVIVPVRSEAPASDVAHADVGPVGAA